ncbi:hypothetical protein HK099_001839, partial [Clydaea vesicula]
AKIMQITFQTVFGLNGLKFIVTEESLVKEALARKTLSDNLVYSNLGRFSKFLSIMIKLVSNDDLERLILLFEGTEKFTRKFSTVFLYVTEDNKCEMEWEYLQKVLFVITFVSKGVTENAIFAKTKPLKVFSLIKITFRVFFNLHFVTLKFGSEGFSVWQQVLKNLVELMEIYHDDEENENFDTILTDLMKFAINYDHSSNENKIIKSSLLYTVALSKQLSNKLNLSTVAKLMNILNHYIPVPASREILNQNEEKPSDSSFNVEVEISREVNLFFQSVFNDFKFASLIFTDCPKYATLIIECYPTKLDFDILLSGISVAFKSISNLDAALDNLKDLSKDKYKSEYFVLQTFTIVEDIFKKMSSTSEQKLQMNYFKLLFSQIRAINFQYLGSYLEILQCLIIKNELPWSVENKDDRDRFLTTEILEDLLEILFDIISDPRGYDYTRKDMCLRWFLELKSTIKELESTR